jgi:hypothetical protein
MEGERAKVAMDVKAKNLAAEQRRALAREKRAI